MSTPSAEPASRSTSGAPTVNSNFNKWNDLKPKLITQEDSMSPTRVKEAWRKMMDFAGLKNINETEQAAFRAAVYTYACLNGTSREGNYETEFTMANGTVVSASVIPRAVGKLNIRKFFRGNMQESYEYFKVSRVMEEFDRFVSKCAALGISSNVAFATADWLDDCPYFTPSESKAHQASFTYGLTRARVSRGGTLEQVEQNRVDKVLESNGSGESESGNMIKF